jgi:small subunit ribosomal protein S17
MTGISRTRIGKVISDKMDKTVVVAVDIRKKHRLYKKSYKVTIKYKAHDEHNNCRLGDTVRIVETRPISKGKKWRIMEILSRHEVIEEVET